jgi:hypothetical protein
VFQKTTTSNNPVVAPRNVESMSTATVQLTWQPSTNAVRYNIYRATVQPLEVLVPWLFPTTITGPDGKPMTVTLEDVKAGKLDGYCNQIVTDSTCGGVEMLEAAAGLIPASYPLAVVLVGKTAGTSFSEAPPSRLQSIYYVRAVDAQGRLSDVSNMVAAPSKRADMSTRQCDVDVDGDVDRNDISLITEAITVKAAPRGTSDARDAQKDGVININDSRFCATKCSKPGCSL